MQKELEQHGEIWKNYVDLITQDSSVGEFLDPEKWTPVSISLPYDHSGNKIKVAKVDDEWVALPHLSVDDTEGV